MIAKLIVPTDDQANDSARTKSIRNKRQVKLIKPKKEPYGIYISDKLQFLYPNKKKRWEKRKELIKLYPNLKLFQIKKNSSKNYFIN